MLVQGGNVAFMSRATILFSYAFRPLFLLCIAYALVAVPVWVLAWVGWAPTTPAVLGNPVWWHAHEMLFGFAGAAVGGFLLTAVATWTNRAPLAGGPLVALALLWLNARLLLSLPSAVSAGWVVPAAAAADLGYDVLLLVLMSREVIAARSQRNYKVLVLLALLAVANAAFYVGIESRFRWVDASLLGGLWVFVLLIAVVGGRVIPAFTRNWLRLRGAAEDNIPSFDRLDLVATVALLVFASLTMVPAPPIGVAVAGLLAATLQLLRLGRWRGLRARREPLVWILHLAFLWIPVGILLLSAAALGWCPRSAGIHALTVGAIATMIMAIAGRAALGHTGRPLQSHPVLTAAYVLITVAALSRVAVVFVPDGRAMLLLAGACWVLGFACFGWRYIPVLLQAHVDEMQRA